MTPREPDRYELAPDALERIARAFEANPTAQHSGAAVASVLRYLARGSPAAAPAAVPGFNESVIGPTQTLSCGCVKDRFQQYIRRCDLHPATQEPGPPSETVAPAPECTCPPSDRELQARGLLLRHVKTCPLRSALNAPVPDPAQGAEALLSECENVIRKLGHPRTCWYWRYDGMADDRRDINMRGDCDCGADALLKKLAARAATPAKGDGK